MVKSFADRLGAHIACTRPLVEAGWFDAKHQIGLSGRTVKPRLIITAGISGSVQFAAGMRSSDIIIAVNNDKNARIFDIAHFGFVGDLYEILPRLADKMKEAHNV
jgi:electron transfer flavoprotein alpha subunit